MIICPNCRVGQLCHSSFNYRVSCTFCPFEFDVSHFIVAMGLTSYLYGDDLQDALDSYYDGLVTLSVSPYTTLTPMVDVMQDIAEEVSSRWEQPKQHECSWQTYDSGWTRYEFCECGNKK